MDRYLIETPHTDKDCLRMLEHFDTWGHFYHFGWGCEDGVHCGWAIIEAESDSQARMSVPPLVRKKARVVKLVQFDFDRDRRLHKV